MRFYHVAMKFCWVLMRCDDPCRDARCCSWKVAPTHLLVGVLIHGGTRTHSYTHALLSVSHARSVKSGVEIASALFLAMLPFCTFGLLKMKLGRIWSELSEESVICSFHFNVILVILTPQHKMKQLRCDLSGFH